MRGYCAHLAGLVKSNSSGVEVWRDSLIQADRGAVDSLNPPQRGLGVTGKSSRSHDKFLSHARLLLCLIYFLQFTLSFIFLEIKLILVTLGRKPLLVIGLARYRCSLVL